MEFARYKLIIISYNYQNAFRSCNLYFADLYHVRAILHKRKKTEYNSLLQSILVLVAK